MIPVKVITGDKSVNFQGYDVKHRFEKISDTTLDDPKYSRIYHCAEKRIQNKARKYCTEVLTRKGKNIISRA